MGSHPADGVEADWRGQVRRQVGAVLTVTEGEVRWEQPYLGQGNVR